MGFFKIILIAALIFYIFAMVIKLVFKRKMRKLEEQMKQFTQDESQPKKDDSNNPHIDPNIGEYTDFEEIDN